MLLRRAQRSSEGRRGFVLLAVLIVIVVLSLTAVQFSDMMLAEYKAADSARRLAQARAFALSGVHYTAALLASSDPTTTNLYDNPQMFQDIVVQDSDNPHNRGRFSILAPLSPDETQGSAGPFHYGVGDEAGKINVNALLQLDSSGQVGYNMLIQLPNMTDDVANSMLDWIDPTSTSPRPDGAKDEYYTTQSPAYHVKNGPLDSVDEMLLVKGVTPALLWGNDLNRNGILDPNEEANGGTVDRGWSAYLTAYSRELNVDSQGNPRININDPDLQNLSNMLSSDTNLDPVLAAYILAYRQYGPASTQQGGSGAGGTGGKTGGTGMGGQGGTGMGGQGAARGGNTQTTQNTQQGMMTTSGGGGDNDSSSTNKPTSGFGATPKRGPPTRLQSSQLNLRQGGSKRIASLYELINSSVSIPDPNNSSQSTSYPSPMSDSGSIQQYLPEVLDELTTVSTPQVPARVNVNTAPSAVLTALPNIQPGDVQNIIDHRPPLAATQAPDPIFQTPAWLITQANLTPATLRTLDKYITTRSQVYRVQSVGYFDGGGPAVRVEAVIDVNNGRPRIIALRDLTVLGKGFPVGAQAAQGMQP